MIREDRELLAELARLNTAMASLALRIMDGSASAAEQHNYAQRLIAAGERLGQRANEMNHPVIEGEVLTEVSIALPGHTAECYGELLDPSSATPDPVPGRCPRPAAYRTALADGRS